MDNIDHEQPGALGGAQSPRQRQVRRAKDPTAAARQRRYRQRKSKAGALVTRDACDVTAPVTPATVTEGSVAAPRPSVTGACVTAVPPPVTSRPRLLIAVTLLLGIVTAAVGLWLNASFLWAFGRTAEAGVVLAVIGLVTDGVTLVTPSVTLALWSRHRYALSVTAVMVYLGAVTLTALNGLGFAHSNIGDAVTGRSAVTQQRAAIIADIGRLKAERVGLQFSPTTGEAAAAATVARDQECGRVGPNCRQRVAELNAALKDRDLTDHAADLDRRIAAATAALARLPTVASADPQVEAATAVIVWLSRGSIAPSAGDIEMLRLLGVALMPILAGLLIAFAVGLAQPVRSGGRSL